MKFFRFKHDGGELVINLEKVVAAEMVEKLQTRSVVVSYEADRFTTWYTDSQQAKTTYEQLVLAWSLESDLSNLWGDK